MVNIIIALIPWPAREHTLTKMADTLLTRGVGWFDGVFNVESYTLSSETVGVSGSSWTDPFVINQNSGVGNSNFRGDWL